MTYEKFSRDKAGVIHSKILPHRDSSIDVCHSPVTVERDEDGVDHEVTTWPGGTPVGYAWMLCASMDGEGPVTGSEARILCTQGMLEGLYARLHEILHGDD